MARTRNEDPQKNRERQARFYEKRREAGLVLAKYWVTPTQRRELDTLYDKFKEENGSIFDSD